MFRLIVTALSSTLPRYQRLPSFSRGLARLYLSTFCVCLSMCILCFLCSLCRFPLQLSPSVLWYCWLGLLTCKNRLPYNLYCVGGTKTLHNPIQSLVQVRLRQLCVFVGLPAYFQRRLQTVLNSTASVVFRLRRYDHVSDALAILHWLRLPERVNFKLALTAYRVLALPYLNQLVPVSSLSGRRRLRSSFTL